MPKRDTVTISTRMDKFVPDWRARRDRLNGAPLVAQDWRVVG